LSPNIHTNVSLSQSTVVFMTLSLPPTLYIFWPFFSYEFSVMVRNTRSLILCLFNKMSHYKIISSTGMQLLQLFLLAEVQLAIPNAYSNSLMTDYISPAEPYIQFIPFRLAYATILLQWLIGWQTLRTQETSAQRQLPNSAAVPNCPDTSNARHFGTKTFRS